MKVVCLWIGWPMSHAKYAAPIEIPSEDRHRFLLFLEAHNLTIRDFLSVIKGEKIPRYLIDKKDFVLASFSGPLYHFEKTR